MIDRLTALSRGLRRLAREFIEDTGMLGSVIAVVIVVGIAIAVLTSMIILSVLLA